MCVEREIYGKRRGVFAEYAILPEGVICLFFKMTRREIKLISTMGRTWETWRRMTQLITSERLNLKPLVARILALEQHRVGFELVKSNQVMKVLLKP